MFSKMEQDLQDSSDQIFLEDLYCIAIENIIFEIGAGKLDNILEEGLVDTEERIRNAAKARFDVLRGSKRI